MQIQHDKHQYFFEKFLRNEMKPEEAKLFTQRLESDLEFKEDFEFYLRNRQNILAEELAEYDEPELLIKKPERWGWLYAILSILCLVLIVDYFLSVRYAEKLDSEKKRRPLIERINIFSSKPTKEQKAEALDGKASDSKEEKEAILEKSDSIGENLTKEILPYLGNDHASIKGDYFVMDSLFKVIEVEMIDEWVSKLRIQTDSAFSDSVMTLLSIKEILKNESALKRQLLVEFWDSELHFRGYIFDGKKLILYDMDKLPGIALTYEANLKVYHLYVASREYHIFDDGRLHALGE